MILNMVDIKTSFKGSVINTTTQEVNKSLLWSPQQRVQHNNLSEDALAYTKVVFLAEDMDCVLISVDMCVLCVSG